MKLLNFTQNGRAGYTLGVKLDGGIFSLDASIEAVLNGDAALPSSDDLAAATGLLDESELSYGPPVPNPSKIICVGLNYRQHAAEAGLAVPEVPILFSKYNNAVAASGAEIPLPAIAEQFDYEGELGVVIGRKASNVPVSEALNYVFGYMTANDLSARDLQTRTSQWMLGKTLDNFFPSGPYLVSADDVPDPQALRLRTWVNGELRQDSSSADMIFTVAEIISYISHHLTLSPGDVIITGTPQGVIAGTQEKIWLKPGDVVSVEVEGLGRLSNKLVAAI